MAQLQQPDRLHAAAASASAIATAGFKPRRQGHYRPPEAAVRDMRAGRLSLLPLSLA